MSIELHDITLRPIWVLSVCVLRSPEISYCLVVVLLCECIRVSIEVSVIVDEGFAKDIREVSLN